MDHSERTQALRRRPKLFAGAVVRFYVGLDRRREKLSVLGKQPLRSGTSVGANYREASRSRSDAEFIAKIELCAEEADETQYWLELLNEDCEISKTRTQPIWDEADKLIRIFVTMSQNTKKRKNSQ
ncbi:MAG: four helix bundle protein [Lentimonas sp.]|jgi:four helix bundle protein